jgi:ATP-dependent Clp protease ATP-binding subunit ClpA
VGEKGEGRVIFNRFAKEARRCVEAALEEARLLGHDSVGDEDLLLGVLRAGEGVTAEALSSMGVTSEAVREESEASFAEALSSIGISLEEVRREAGEAFEMRLPDDRRIPFSPRAKKALEGALREAIRLQDNRITDEHVLRGLLREEDGTAVRLLGNLGVTPASLEERLDQLRGRAA